MKLKRPDSAKIAIDMTPMIDIVFQLLTFFCMTLRIASAEGDFSIRLPLSTPQAADPNQSLPPPLLLHLRADAKGELKQVILNEIPFEGPDRWRRLHNHIAGTIDPGSLQATSQELVLDCDYNLRYEHVIEAITAVSGQKSPDGKIIKLIEKISFKSQ